MDEIGILFDAGRLGGPQQVALKAWKIFMENCKGETLAATTLYCGELAQSIGDADRPYCIAVYSDDESQLNYVRDVFGGLDNDGLLPLEHRLLDGPVTSERGGSCNLIKKWEVDLGGRLIADKVTPTDKQLCSQAGWEMAEGSEDQGDPMDIVLKVAPRPMHIKFRCASCNHEYKVDIKHAGKTGKCKHCGKLMHIPTLPSASDAPKVIDTDADNTPAVMFMSNPHHTGKYATVGRDRPPKVRWKASTGGTVRSTPVVLDGMLYVGSDDGFLYAFDPASGTEKWKYEAGSPISSSPATAKGLVFFGCEDGHVCAVQGDGGLEVWKFKTRGTVHSPVYVCDTVIVGSDDGYIYSFDSETGQEKWKHSTDFPVSGAPAIAGGAVFYGNAGGMIESFDFGSGKTNWTIGINAKIFASAMVAHGKVFFASSDNNLYALDPASGKEKWKFTTGAQILSSPAAGNDLVFVASMDGCLYAIKPSGQEAWKVEDLGPITSSPAVVEDVVYLGCGDGNVCAFDTENGKLLWKIDVGGVGSSICVDDCVVFVGGVDGGVYALGESADGSGDSGAPIAAKVPMARASAAKPSVSKPAAPKPAAPPPDDDDGPLSLAGDDEDESPSSGGTVSASCMLCGKPNDIDKAMIGQTVKCSHCGGKFKAKSAK